MGLEEKYEREKVITRDYVPYCASLEPLITELVCHGNKNILRSTMLKIGGIRVLPVKKIGKRNS